MSYEHAVRKMADETDLDNAAISAAVGCSERTVRRYAGRHSTRMAIKNGLKVASPAKILLFDLETAPMEVYVWSLMSKQNLYINHGAVIKDLCILSWSAKWLFDPTVMSGVATATEAQERDDERLTREMWDLFEEADIVIAHNAKQFDVRRMNGRFIKHGHTPPMPYRIIDTLQEARKTFDFASYKLDYLNERFGLSKKLDTNFQLWRDCVENNERSAAALERMKVYNKSDVVALEELYLFLRPWIKSHPPISLYQDQIDAETCASCGGTNLDWGGTYTTPAGRYEAFRCESCGAIGRSRYSDLTKEDRANLVVSTAR